MADKELVVREELENSGLLDFKGLYSYAHSWFADQKYGVDEERYAEKVSGDKRDIQIRWRATKYLSDYFKVEIQIDFEIGDLTEVNVEINGSQKTMNKGKVKVKLKGTLVRDPNSKWETSPFNRFMRDVYNRYVIPSRIDDTRYKISSDVKNFKDDIKAYLELLGRR